MEIIKGKGVFGAVAIGKIVFYKRGDIAVSREKAEDTESEKSRYGKAKQQSLSQLGELYEKALKEVGETGAQIFDIHRMMIEDEDYNESVINIIESQQVNAEYAVAATADNFASMFSSMDDEYMKARAADVKDISNRIIKNLSLGGEEKIGSDGKYILFADDLAPSETVSLDKENVLAFVTEYGSANSHTAILARTMNIPAVVGTGEAISAETDGKLAVVDGFTGEVFIEPDEKTLSALTEKRDNDIRKKELLQELKGKENVTLDGHKIDVFANISGLSDIGSALINDAGGVGLFRSEFLYLESNDYPDEQTQFLAYKRVLESMAGKRVIIRTLDIGADKQIGYFGLPKEENPALGFRAIRICLARPEIFRTQLRALLRASVYGRLGIMFPMITSLSEITEIKRLLEEVKKELDGEKLGYSSDTRIGIMIETPAAAVVSDKLAPEVDFFSVGTNDLTQYTLAVDRQNPMLERFCDTHHEAVLRLIEYAADSAHKNGKWIGICGELAADTELTERWLRMGIDELSVSPAFILPIRERIRSLDLRRRSY